MSTILKDSEANSSTSDAQPARSTAVSNEAAAKPQPVALEVSVTVNGARTVDGSDKREPFSESTKTVLVFGHGAVIRLQSSVAAGQLLFLTNEKTKKEVVCQVVKSKNYRNVSGYVELEFTEPVVGFWGMRFPGDRIAPAAVPAAGSPAAPVAANHTAPTSAPQNKISPAVIPAPSVVSKPVAAAPIAPAKSQEVTPSYSVPNVAPVLPFVNKLDATTNSTTSSSAVPSASVLTLPRAAQPKAASPQIVATPSPVAPTVPPTPPSVVHQSSTIPAENISAEKTSADSAAEALRAENARLQEQLSALLFPGAKKVADPGPPVANVESKATETASKIFDLAHTNGAPTPVKTLPVQTNAFVIAPPAPASLTPTPPEITSVVAKAVTPFKVAESPLKSLLDDDEVKVPSWLEPLARNAAIPAPAQEHAVELEAAHVANEALQVVTPVAEIDAGTEDFSNVPAPTFGSRLLMDEHSAGAEAASGSKKFLVIGLIAAGLVAAAGGYWYTHQGPATPVASVAASVATPATPQNAEAAPAQQAASPNATQTQRVPQGAAARTGAIIDQTATPPAVNANLAVNPSRMAATTPSQISPTASAVPPPVAPVKRAALGDVHLAAPNVSRKNDGSSLNEAEPPIALNGATEGASLGAGFASGSGPSAPVAPVPIGGVVKTAQLLTSTRPVYPAFAKTQRVSGDVKIDALIDATGRVTTMKVVSGPAILHQAAMDALRVWKYQPATLDGKPVPIHLAVTIQFRMQ